jgi:hypothetical protein
MEKQEVLQKLVSSFSGHSFDTKTVTEDSLIKSYLIVDGKETSIAWSHLSDLDGNSSMILGVKKMMIDAVINEVNVYFGRSVGAEL